MHPAIRLIRVGLVAASLGIAAAGSLWADTIYLKNGRTIYATNIVRQDGKLIFDTAGGTISMSEALVDKIVSDDSESSLELTPKPKAVREVAPAPAPTSITGTATAAATAAPKPTPAAAGRQPHTIKLAAARPMRLAKPKPADLQSTEVPRVEQAMIMLPQIEAARPASPAATPRDARKWFLSDSAAGVSSESARAVHVGGFAKAVDPESGTENRTQARAVQAGSFESVQVIPRQADTTAVAAQGAELTQGVVVLSGPEAVYTEEARKLGIEGQVLLEVVFQASGEMRVNRVVQGLGHGLDDESVRAAQQIRFKPATQQGRAVDYPATLHIVFQLNN